MEAHGRRTENGQTNISGQTYLHYTSGNSNVFVELQTIVTQSASLPAGFSGPDNAAGIAASDIPDIVNTYEVLETYGFAVHEDYTVYEQENYVAVREELNGQNATAILLARTSALAPPTVFTNHGTLSAYASSTSVSAVTVRFDDFDQSLINFGTITAEASGFQTYGVYNDHHNGQIINFGQIEVLSHAEWANGIRTSGGQINNAGQIIVTALAGTPSNPDYQAAVGIATRQTFQIENSGEIIVTSAGHAFGMDIADARGQDDVLINSGLIEATTTEEGYTSIGIRLRGRARNPVDDYILENSGTIRADNAIEYAIHPSDISYTHYDVQFCEHREYLWQHCIGHRFGSNHK